MFKIKLLPQLMSQNIETKSPIIECSHVDSKTLFQVKYYHLKFCNENSPKGAYHYVFRYT